MRINTFSTNNKGDFLTTNVLISIEPPLPFRGRGFANLNTYKCFRVFYCTVVPTVISNPFLRIFFEALTSRSWWALQCGQSHSRIPIFPIPATLLFLLPHSLQICVDGKCLGIFMNSTPSRWHLYSNLSITIRGAFNCTFLLKWLFWFHAIIFSFWTAMKEEFLTEEKYYNTNNKVKKLGRV